MNQNKNSSPLKGLSLNQLTELLNFTNAYADHLTGKATTFRRDDVIDMRITDSNRDQVLAEVKRSAAEYAEARNKGNGTTPKSFSNASPQEKTIRDDLMKWLERQKQRGHGKRINND